MTSDDLILLHPNWNQEFELHTDASKFGWVRCLHNIIKENLDQFGMPLVLLRGKAKRTIHARYPFLGGGTYQPPVLSVLYLQVGYQPVAAGKSGVIYVGPTRSPYSLSDNYTRGPIRCPYPLSDENKRRVPHTTRYPEDMTECWGSKRGKVMVHTAVPGRFLENMGTHIFFLKGVPHPTRQLSGL